MNNTIYLTKQGLQRARAELDYIIKTRRPAIMKHIRNAREAASGDNEDNLKDEQFMIENRIIELEALIRKATVVEKVDTNEVSIGAKVKLKYLDNDEVKTYSIVGAYEADPRKNKISYESPVARALIGKKVDDVATVALKFSRFDVMVLGISA